MTLKNGKRLNVKTIKKKMENEGRHWLFKYEQVHLRRKTEDVLIRLCQNLPKLIATKWKTKKAKCLTCSKVCDYPQLAWCHAISRWHKSCKYEERNIFSACWWCNNPRNQPWNQNHINILTSLVIENIWLESFNSHMYWLWEKPTYWELLDKIEYYKARYRELWFEKFI